ncbi:MAG: carboxypeptidase regulatory-like domain-containing protein [Gemmatimonadaceae bacterium]
MLPARLITGQAPAISHRDPVATVSGLVRDSVARTPLVGAIVQLVAAEGGAAINRTAVSDSIGRFSLSDVPNGRFMLGFFHPMLDSLGVDAPLREVNVDGQRVVRADLAIPSPARLRAAICGAKPASKSDVFLIGIVRNAQDGAPVAGARVKGEWLELSFRRDGLARRIPSLVATTGTNGWFAMCNLPSDGTIELVANRGADSTAVIEVQVPAEGLLRHDLYIGAAGAAFAAGLVTTTNAPVAGVTSGENAVAGPSRTVRRGNGRLSGTVVATAGGKPLAGAQVSLTDGPEARTNERGEWTIVQAPGGTRMLEVRAVGYYPERRRVDVVTSATPIHLTLSTLKTVLDTVKILASRRVYDRDRNGFQHRRRAGLGRYLTAEDISRQRPIVTSDLFRNMSGVRVASGATALDRQILVRGNMAEWCSPSIYLDGHNVGGLTAEDIDVWVDPDDVGGIEIYPGLGTPPEFQQGMNNCGSILIWTK